MYLKSVRGNIKSVRGNIIHNIKKLEKAQVPINKKDKLSYISAMEFYAMMKMSEPHQTITRMILTNKSIEIVRSRKIYVSLIYTKFF